MPLHPKHLCSKTAVLTSLALVTALATSLTPVMVGWAVSDPSGSNQLLSQATNPSSEALLALSQAERSLDNGRYAEAIQLFQTAILRYEALKDKSQVETAKDGMAKAYFLGKQPKIAIQLFEEQMARQRVKDGRVSVNLLHNLGSAYFQVKKYAEAERVLRAAIADWEQSRQAMDALDRKDNTLITLFEQQIYTYRLLQKVLVAQNKTNEALEVAEQSRARALVELLSQRQGEQQFSSPNVEQMKQIARSRNATLVEYSIVGQEIRVLGNERDEETDLFIWVVQPKGEVTFRQVKLPATSAMPLSKLVLETRQESLGVRGAARQKQAMPLSGDSSTNVELQELYQLLIAPIADRLPADPEAQVVIIPQGSLYLVPFAALQDRKGTYLIQKHTLVSASSAQVMELTRRTQKLRRQSQGTSSLVVGNPTMPSIPMGAGNLPEPLAELPGAEKEAKAIAPLLHTQPLLGDQATKTAVVQALPRQRIIHLATHGLLDLDANLNEFGKLLNSDVPTARQLGVRATSGKILIGGNVTVNGRPAAEVFAREKIVRVGLPGAIALAPSPGSNGFLTAKEIAEMHLTADMVVLSACNTGRGRITGDGVVGLSRAFIAAGVPSVIVSLWAVSDAPTASLMMEFYQNLQRKPDKAWALRQATLTTLKQFPDPKDWGAFVLIGES